jgi:hypothetical protein
MIEAAVVAKNANCGLVVMALIGGAAIFEPGPAVTISGKAISMSHNVNVAERNFVCMGIFVLPLGAAVVEHNWVSVPLMAQYQHFADASAIQRFSDSLETSPKRRRRAPAEVDRLFSGTVG